MGKTAYSIHAVVKSTESLKWKMDVVRALAERTEFTTKDPVLCTSLDIMIKRGKALFNEECYVPLMHVIDLDSGERVFESWDEAGSDN